MMRLPLSSTSERGEKLKNIGRLAAPTARDDVEVVIDLADRVGVDGHLAANAARFVPADEGRVAFQGDDIRLLRLQDPGDRASDAAEPGDHDMARLR